MLLDSHHDVRRELLGVLLSLREGVPVGFFLGLMGTIGRCMLFLFECILLDFSLFPPLKIRFFPPDVIMIYSECEMSVKVSFRFV